MTEQRNGVRLADFLDIFTMSSAPIAYVFFPYLDTVSHQSSCLLWQLPTSIQSGGLNSGAQRAFPFSPSSVPAAANRLWYPLMASCLTPVSTHLPFTWALGNPLTLQIWLCALCLNPPLAPLPCSSCWRQENVWVCTHTCTCVHTQVLFSFYLKM